MEKNWILHHLNPIDIAVFHFTYLPLTNEKLDVWTKHRIRTIKLSPIHLYVSGQLNFPTEEEFNEQEHLAYAVEGLVKSGVNLIAHVVHNILRRFLVNVLANTKKEQQR